MTPCLAVASGGVRAPVEPLISLPASWGLLCSRCRKLLLQEAVRRQGSQARRASASLVLAELETCCYLGAGLMESTPLPGCCHVPVARRFLPLCLQVAKLSGVICYDDLVQSAHN